MLIVGTKKMYKLYITILKKIVNINIFTINQTVVELQLKIDMGVVRLLKTYETSYCTIKCQINY